MDIKKQSAQLYLRLYDEFLYYIAFVVQAAEWEVFCPNIDIVAIELQFLTLDWVTLLILFHFRFKQTNGEKQCNLLAHYLENGAGSNFRDVRIVSDFAGILRFVTGYRK